ncbi:MULTISPECIES: hypothetical protein [unclassified Vibrio]|uniref:hypothetical protein n=1 Tax=unclassified Vibrio TaxID=2614977 RepID=UPI001360D7DC|nr:MULTISPECIES: hypothetical protein [unclassified Vibrio]NAW56941.1 hypothetical protein [Vibrio sp. V36_P2S2PM302]NAX25562.1 hypothetical protein [Vibrio sp. V38_P2S17PM301]
MEKILSKIYTDYDDLRTKFLKKKWFGLKLFVGRTFGKTETYTKLLANEVQFMNDCKLCIVGDLKDADVYDENSVSEIIVYLKNHKEKIIGRGSFLILLAASFGLLSAIGSIADKLDIVNSTWASLPILFLYALLFALLVEREKLNIHNGVTQELINVLELVKSEISKPSDKHS